MPGPFPGDAAAQTLRKHCAPSGRSPCLIACGRGSPNRWASRAAISARPSATNPCIPLDNNAAERALRGPVVGRKNHYGSRSLRGAEVAAVFYTLCETARLIDVDPHMYVLHAVHAAVDQPGTVTFPEDLVPSSTKN